MENGLCNYYRLTKKEMSFIDSTQAPIVSAIDNKTRLSRPVVVVVSLTSLEVVSVITLSWFRRCIKSGTIAPDLFSYNIRSLY